MKKQSVFCDIFPSAAFAAGIPLGESKMACSTYSGTFPLPFYLRLAEEKISLRGEKMSLVRSPGYGSCYEKVQNHLMNDYVYLQVVSIIVFAKFSLKSLVKKRDEQK